MVGIAIALTMQKKTVPVPVLAIKMDGSITSPSPEKWRPDTYWIKVPGGRGIEFWGNTSGWMITDHPFLALEKQFTISVWLKPYAYVIAGPQAQIMFRGDDRPGYDPYSLAIHDDGTVFLRFDNDQNITSECRSKTKLPLNRWSHVLANFTIATQTMKIFVNGVLETSTKTPYHPLGVLDDVVSAGLGVGNTQSDNGNYNQPYHGALADLRLYNVAVDPTDIGFNPNQMAIK